MESVCVGKSVSHGILFDFHYLYDSCKMSREAGEELSRENISKNPVADLRGVQGMPPPSKFFQFHAVFGKIWQNLMLAPLPRANPGSATAIYQLWTFIW